MFESLFQDYIRISMYWTVNYTELLFDVFYECQN